MLVCRDLSCADDTYKIRVFNPDKPGVEATFLGPTFGGPITQLVMFKSSALTANGGLAVEAEAEAAAFLAYRTAERVVGLIAWPLDGDPQRTMGLIAHPGELRGIAISYDGRKLLTAGEERRGGGGGHVRKEGCLARKYRILASRRLLLCDWACCLKHAVSAALKMWLICAVVLSKVCEPCPGYALVRLFR